MTSPKTPGVPARTAGGLTLREITWLAIQDALERNEGNKTRAAIELGIGRTTLFRWMREMNLPANRQAGKGPFKRAK